MHFLSSALAESREFLKLKEKLLSEVSPIALTGFSGVHKALLISAFSAENKIIFVASDEAECTRVSEDLRELGIRCAVFPERDFTFKAVSGYSKEYEQRRLNTLSGIIEGAFDVVLLSVSALSQFTVPKDKLKKLTLTVKVGEIYKPDELAALLVLMGYTRSDIVEGAGQFSKRGGILDIFPPSSDLPLRLDFFGDEIESAFYFDPISQRRIESADSLKFIPSSEVFCSQNAELSRELSSYAHSDKKLTAQQRETLLKDAELLENGISVPFDRYLSAVFEERCTLLDYFDNPLVMISESASVKERFKGFSSRLNEDITELLSEGIISPAFASPTLDEQGIWNALKGKRTIFLENFPRSSYPLKIKDSINFDLKQLTAFSGSVDVLLEDIGFVSDKKSTVILSGEKRGAKVLCDELKRRGYPAVFEETAKGILKGGILVTTGGLSSGFEIPKLNLTVISRQNRAAAKKRRRSDKNSKPLGSLEELKSGDYVVHISHGIGVFDGIHSMSVEGVKKDYIKIKYAGTDVLYVPVTQLDLVSKYIGTKEDGTVRVNKLGGSEWQKTRTRVKKAVKDMAKQLTALYAKRMQIKGYAFSRDTDLQSDFERRFPYEETEDQLRCVDEIKSDMEREVPMDRLLCGDVGFGKTEVAMRAAFKCIAEGKQCALLVPTTILAWQHYNTAVERFGEMPIECDFLSRFKTARQQSAVIKRIALGEIDMVIGTHRIISDDVKFRDLGLLIVDEEQRFGVGQKEKLKEKFPNVDVLTLSATPIPRTLNMAMSGLRDMSVIEEAPQDRRPVQTYVIEQDNGIIFDAIERELRRSGQVYYLHNNVDSIERCALKIKERFPDSRIEVAHGKMDESRLSSVWKRLVDREIDILVCTTIIETGVDVPNANTLIIEDADRMGLSQLHQLRGRVGRSPRRAYAYLCFKRGKALSDIASKRLDAIRDFTEFGSGFKIAMRDLEIRGAGSILGGEQHGHLEAVGYDMYLRLLSDAMNEEKGIEVKREIECTVDLNINAHIPERYIDSLPARLGIYRRIADIKNEEDRMDVIDELCDRFGKPPKSVMGLMDVALIRNRAARLGVREIIERGDSVVFYLADAQNASVSKVAAVTKKRFFFNASNKPYMSIRKKLDSDALKTLTEVLDIMESKPDTDC